MALAPVPITATVLPVRSTSWFQRALWKVSPAKRSRPGRFGQAGRLSWPVAVISARAVIGPLLVSRCQRPEASSKRAPLTLVPKRICGCSRYLSAQWRR